MTTHISRCQAVVYLAFVLQSTAPAQTSGIPEPGLVIYGTVVNLNGNVPATPASVKWTINGGGSSASITATLVNVNGQAFYVARVPFETRSASGVNFKPTPNTLPFSPSSLSFNRTVLVDGVPGNIAAPSLPTFPFGGGDRGKVERVNLTAALQPTDPNLDSDEDGMSDQAEMIAGTNPKDKNSVLKLDAEISPASGGGLTISWSSTTGKTYAISRTASLSTSFTILSAAVPSGGASTSYTDSSASVDGPFFYRIQVKQ